MESQIKTSFIPKQMPNSGKINSTTNSSGDAFDIVLLISIVAFVAAIVLAAGVFLYGEFLNKSAESKKAQLGKARGAFDQGLIQELLVLDRRLATAGVVLDNHLAPSQLLTLLGDVTLRSVEYKKLEYDTESDGKIKLLLEGVAQSVNSVALQASLFSKHNAIENPIFSNLNLVKHSVTFDVTATINPSAINYGSVYESTMQQALKEAEATGAADTTVTGVTEDNQLGAFAPNQGSN